MTVFSRLCASNTLLSRVDCHLAADLCNMTRQSREAIGSSNHEPQVEGGHGFDLMPREAECGNCQTRRPGSKRHVLSRDCLHKQAVAYDYS